MKPKNIKEAELLIARYREITLQDINSVWDSHRLHPGGVAARALTGFGRTDDCILCKGVETKLGINCKRCIHGFENSMADADCIYHRTYLDIKHAQTKSNLLDAFRARANYIANLLKQWQ